MTKTGQWTLTIRGKPIQFKPTEKDTFATGIMSGLLYCWNGNNLFIWYPDSKHWFQLNNDSMLPTFVTEPSDFYQAKDRFPQAFQTIL